MYFLVRVIIQPHLKFYMKKEMALITESCPRYWVWVDALLTLEPPESGAVLELSGEFKGAYNIDILRVWKLLDMYTFRLVACWV
jgi:hypothetical protein